VRDLVDEALTLSGLALRGGGSVRITVSLHEHGEVVVDRRLMVRVLVNLLTNAREAIDGTGEIELAAAVQPAANGADELEFTVRDTGRGMPEEFVRTRLFRPFSTTKANGLGIGLAQCRTIVEAHGGRIEVRTRPGAGTTFIVRVPASVPEEPPAAAWAGGEGPGGEER